MKLYFYKYSSKESRFRYWRTGTDFQLTLENATFFESKKEAKECKDFWCSAYDLSDLKLHSISGDLALKIKFKQLQTFIENLESKFNLLTVDNYGDY